MIKSAFLSEACQAGRGPEAHLPGIMDNELLRFAQLAAAAAVRAWHPS